LVSDGGERLPGSRGQESAGCWWALALTYACMLLAWGTADGAPTVGSPAGLPTEVRGQRSVDVVNDLAASYRDSEPHRAIELAGEAADLARKAGDRAAEARALQTRGVALDKLDMLEDALESYFQALRLYEELDDQRGPAGLFNNIGVVYQKLGQYDRALEYLERSRSIYGERGDRLGQAKATLNRAVVFREQNRYADSLASYMEVLETSEAVGNAYGAALARTSIGNLYDLMGRPADGLESLRRGYTDFKSQGNRYFEALSSIWLGQAYTHLGQFPEAEQMLLSGMDVAREIDARGLIMDNYKAQSDLFARKGQPDLALGAYRQYHRLSSEIFNTETARKAEEVRARYETERHRLEMEHVTRQASRERLMMLAIMAAVGMIGLLALNRYRMRARANRIIEAKNRELEAVDRIVKVINREVEINSLLRALLHEVRALLPQATGGGFLLRDRTQPRYVLRMSFGGDHADAEGCTIDEGTVQERYIDKARELLDGIHVTTDVPASAGIPAECRLPAARAAVAVRVAVDRAPEGLMFFESATDPAAFGEGDVLKLQRVREHAVSALLKAMAHEELQRAARTDPLTGLSNRRYAMELIGHEVRRSQRTGRPLSFVLCDVDRFKQFNDHYGHACGDYVLVSLAQFIQRAVRDLDRLARWGGEEFLLILPDTDVAGAAQLAEKIRSSIETLRISYEGRQHRVTMTFGVSGFESARTVAECLGAADRALYRGKRRSRNRVVVSDELPLGLDANPADPQLH